MEVKFSDEQKRVQIEALKQVLDRRLSVTLDDLDAEMIVDELKQSIGVDAYNLGVADAQAYLSAKLTDLGIDVYAEPQPQTTAGQVARKPSR